MAEIIQPASSLSGTLSIPGDKSISHRAIMLGAIAEGTTRVTNLAPGKDVRSTASCMRQMGVSITIEGDEATVYGVGMKGLQKPSEVLDAGNSGTTTRLLSGILAAQPFDSTIAGDDSLQSRPMKRIITPLKEMGAEIESREGFKAPLRIHGGTLHPIHYHSPVASAQIKSCVMLAGLFADGRTSITEPVLSRDHSERMLPAFGVPVHLDGLTVSVDGPARLTGCDINVPGDISSAAFFMIAAALVPGSKVTLQNVGVNPTREGVIEVLKMMGVPLELSNEVVINGEPRADIIVRSGPLKGIEISGGMIPRLIDEIPILAIAGTQCQGTFVVKDASELRVKETDRIMALSENLKRMGVSMEVFEDGFTIEGGQALQGAEIETFADHRMAMAFSVAGLIAQGETVIPDSACAEISFPGFYSTLKGLIQND